MSYDFSVDGWDDPSCDVLDFGLPTLPTELQPSQGVAVARWVAGDFGVVLVVYRNEPDDDEAYDPDLEYGYDVQPYVRVNGEWESTNGSGGSNWFSPPFERRKELTARYVAAGHFHSQTTDDDRIIRVVDGLAGSDVKTISVEMNGEVNTMSVESPLGAWVAGVIGKGPARWIARDAAGSVVAAHDFEEMPSWHDEDVAGPD